MHCLFLSLFLSCMLGAVGLAGAQAADEATVGQVAVIDAALQQLGAYEHVRFVYQQPVNLFPEHLDFDVIPPDHFRQLATFIVLFREEFRKYPPEFFRRRGLEQVVFVEKYFFKKTAVDGTFFLQGRMIYFDILRAQGNAAHQRHNIHHEIFHMFAIGHSLRIEEAMAKVNVPGFVYGIKPQPGAKNPYNLFAPATLGFVSEYAMTSPYEDAAELFACLMIKSERDLVLKWAQADPYLASKVTLMQRFIEAVDRDLYAVVANGM